MGKIACWFFLLMIAALSAAAEEPLKDLDREWERQKQMQRRHWDEGIESQRQSRLETDRMWESLAAEQDRQWAMLKAEVEQKWEAFVHSTKTDWVDYGPDKDTRSRLDFVEGRAVFEAVVPSGDPNAAALAREKIRCQAERALSRRDYDGQPILQNQLTDAAGTPVTDKNRQQFISEQIVSRLTQAPGTIEAKDGVGRRRFTASIDLVPNHRSRRAAKYLPLVRENAARFHLRPEMVMAVIETESDFNPLAVSSARAVGIMQIIPKYAGREAYEAVYGTDSMPSIDFLFDPVNNIRLGCAYLFRLRYGHFKDVAGEMKNRYISICAYNWGPTAMRKKVLDRSPSLHGMPDDEVFRMLLGVVPAETANYLRRVTTRMPNYTSMF